MGARGFRLGLALFLIPPMIALAEDTAAGKIQVDGLEIPRTVAVEGETLTLHRTALRKFGFFKIYQGALYLKSPPTSAQAAIATREPLVLRMTYGYMKIPHGPMKEGIAKHFRAALGPDYGGMKAEFEAYMAGYDRSLAVGEVVEVIWHPRFGIRLVISGQTKVQIPGEKFKELLFTTWFGDRAPDPGFRKDLLGF